MTLEEALEIVVKEFKIKPVDTKKQSDCIEGTTEGAYFMIAENDTFFYFTIPEKKMYYSIDKQNRKITAKKPFIH